jgi:hypothetical protein
MAEKVVFISHANEDTELAVHLKDLIEDSFIGSISAFVSSESISPGDDWRQRIRENLRQATDFIILLTPRSYNRPWVNFEAGAAYGRGTRFIPVCAKGLSISHVGPPLGDPQMLIINCADNVRALIRSLARPYGYRPKIDDSRVQSILALATLQPNDLPPPLTGNAKQQETVILRQMREEHDALDTARYTFWETLNNFYALSFKGKSGYVDNLGTLVDIAEPPRGLPLPPGEESQDYPVKYRRLLAGSDSLLYDLCSQVYPPKDSARNLEDCSALPKPAFSDFHKARGALARFWNKWGQSAYEGGEIGLDTIVRSFPEHFRLLKLLSYLEICLEQWTQDRGVGKQWLFRLTRDWRKA